MAGALVLSVFPTFAVGGAQARFTTVANHFGGQFRHAVVAMDGVTTSRERLDPALDVTFPRLDIRKGDTLGNVLRFRAALRVLRPSILLTHNFGSMEWAMANRTGLVRHIHVEDGFGPEERIRQLPRRVWMRRLFLRGRIVALPSRTLVRIATETWRLNPAWLRYVPNGIDLDRFGGPPGPPLWPGEGPVIGTVGALRPEKNFSRLLRAVHLATREQPARLVVIGDGPERPALQALAESLGLAVCWAGHVADPAPLIHTLDIFAMSSDTEQMPMGLLEAMAAGLPAVATDVGDIAAMLPQEARRFVTPPEDGALAAALRILIGDAALRLRLGHANRARAAQEFDQRRMLAAWGGLLSGTEPFTAE